MSLFFRSTITFFLATTSTPFQLLLPLGETCLTVHATATIGGVIIVVGILPAVCVISFGYIGSLSMLFVSVRFCTFHYVSNFIFIFIIYLLELLRRCQMCDDRFLANGDE